MTTTTDLLARLAKNTSTENNKTGSSVVRVCGEEHSASSIGGTATVYLAHDNDMCFISDYKFKIVLNDGDNISNPNAPTPMNVVYGTRSWKTVDEFMRAYPLGSAIDVDGLFGIQCVDYANAFWVGQVGRQIDCGFANARGIWKVQRNKNAGGDFDFITSWSQLKKGDWIVWDGGDFGHIAMAVDSPTGDTIRVWNQNVSGQKWPAGGATLSEDQNTSKHFLGAFRYRFWEG